MHKALYFAFGVAVGAGASWYFWKEYAVQIADVAVFVQTEVRQHRQPSARALQTCEV